MNKPHYTCTLDTKAIEDMAEEKYNAMAPEERAEIDRHIEKLTQHYQSKGYRPLPRKRSLLGLLLQLGTFCNQNDIKTNEREK